MKHRQRIVALAVLLLLCCSVTSCLRTKRAPRKALRDDSIAREKLEAERSEEVEEQEATYEVRDQAWLCKRREDVRVTNRPITDKNRDHFDYRIAKGKLIDLPPGTRLKRRSRIFTFDSAGDRQFIRVEVVGGEYHEERGLVALDSIVRVE